MIGSIIKAAATKYKLPSDLVASVIWHESVLATPNQDIELAKYASRYESGFYERYIAHMHGLTTTESIHRATSWGYMQVMGQVARELGFNKRWLPAICEPEVNIDLGCKKLSKCIKDAKGNEEFGLQRYNGGGNPTYAKRVLSIRESEAYEPLF